MKLPKIPKPNLSKIPHPNFGNILKKKNKPAKNAGFEKKVFKELKKKLEAEKKELEEELKAIAVKDRKVQDDYDAKFPYFGEKMDENAMEVTEYQDRLALHGTLEIDLLRINNALAKIKAGTYGLCEECTRPINIKRLQAFPAAPYCLDCVKKGGGK